MRLFTFCVFSITVVKYVSSKTVYIELLDGGHGSAAKDIADLYAEKMGPKGFTIIGKEHYGRMFQDCDDQNDIEKEWIEGDRLEDFFDDIFEKDHGDKKKKKVLELIVGLVEKHEVKEVIEKLEKVIEVDELKNVLGKVLEKDHVIDEKKKLLELLLFLGKDILKILSGPKGPDMEKKLLDVIKGEKGLEFKKILMVILFKEAGKGLKHFITDPKGLDVNKKFLKGLIGLLGKDVLLFLNHHKGDHDRKKLKDLLKGFEEKNAFDHFFADSKGHEGKKKLMELLIAEAIKKILLHILEGHGPLGGKGSPLGKLLHDHEEEHEKKKLLDFLLCFEGENGLDHFLKDHKGMEIKKKFLKLLLDFVGKDALEFLKDPKGDNGRKKIIHLFLGGAIKKLLADFGFDEIVLEHILVPLGLKGVMDKLFDPHGLKDKLGHGHFGDHGPKDGILGDLKGHEGKNVGDVLKFLMKEPVIKKILVEVLGLKGDDGIDIGKLLKLLEEPAIKKIAAQLLGLKGDAGVDFGKLLKLLEVKEIRKVVKETLGLSGDILDKLFDPPSLKDKLDHKDHGKLKGLLDIHEKKKDIVEHFPLGGIAHKLGKKGEPDSKGDSGIDIGDVLKLLEIPVVKKIVEEVLDLKGGHGLDIEKLVKLLEVPVIKKVVEELLGLKGHYGLDIEKLLKLFKELVKKKLEGEVLASKTHDHGHILHIIDRPSEKQRLAAYGLDSGHHL